MRARIKSWLHTLNLPFVKKQDSSSYDLLEARTILDGLTKDQFSSLRKEIYSIIVNTYFQKKTGLFKDKYDFSIYNIAENDEELKKLYGLSDEGWKEIIIKMIAGSYEIMRLLDQHKEDRELEMRVALINIPALKRAGFRLIKGHQ